MPNLSTMYRKHREKSYLLERLERELAEQRSLFLYGMMGEARRRTGLRNFAISNRLHGHHWVPGLPEGTLYWARRQRGGPTLFVTIEKPDWTVMVTLRGIRCEYIYSRSFKTPEGGFGGFCKQLEKIRHGCYL